MRLMIILGSTRQGRRGEVVANWVRVLIVTPEYNHGYSGVLKNALDWVGREWGDKPVAYVSYGNITAGARAVEQLRQVTNELGLVQVANAIYFPNISRDAFNEAGQPAHTSANDNLKKMFDELLRLHKLFSSAKS
jgi:NAD(P)H-dependent FMN reductase